MRMRPQLGLITALALGTLAIASLPAHAINPPYDPLTLTCVGAGSNYIDVGVRAGDTGAPAGFTLQWMTLSDYEAFGWDDAHLCKMSFSGQPSFTGNHSRLRWELMSNEQVIVHLDDILFNETGVSGALADDGSGNYTQPECLLQCGTEYVFRAFAHASRYNSRSAFSFVSSNGSPNLVEPGEVCATTSTDCGPSPCKLTQGYWSTHGPGGCNIAAGGDMWAEGTWEVGVPTVPGGGAAEPIMKLGNVKYSASQICTILHTPAKGGDDGIILASQLICAKLNKLVNGVTCEDDAIAAADALIQNKIICPTGGCTKVKDPAWTSAASDLDQLNNDKNCFGDACKAAGGAQRSGVQSSKKLPWGQLKVRYR